MKTITTTNGETFTYGQHGTLARLIWLRWGRDLPAAAAAWRRLFQNGCSDHDFEDLLKTALAMRHESL